MIDDINIRVRELYDETILKPELGECALRQRLVRGLERVLDQVKLPKEAILEQSTNLMLDSEMRNREIDYGSIHLAASGLGSKGVVVRLAGALGIENIKTYGDLVGYVNRERSESPRLYRRKSGRIRHIFWNGGIGDTTHAVLYAHLNSLGIKLFPDGYTPKELGKK
ncbi:hypothetical protein HYX05_01675 [Candidatus Woesearchaeota archaeon]|nr:hypothetical protein [Candidatus Woesearchaeota archaeon]